ncbi:hypothetical protein NSERUTF1_3005 [Nocardia seriolae]|nr:hypothetical protein NSERUTF1_3005 [Nocardia seriolae]
MCAMKGPAPQMHDPRFQNAGREGRAGDAGRQPAQRAHSESWRNRRGYNRIGNAVHAESSESIRNGLRECGRSSLNSAQTRI